MRIVEKKDKMKIAELRKELLDFRFEKSSGNLKNTSSIRKKKKELARYLTLVNMKSDNLIFNF